MALTKLNFTGQPTLQSANLPTIPIGKMPSNLFSDGMVLQTIHSNNNITSGTTNGSTTFTTFVFQAITPSSTSSKILIIASINCYVNSGTSYDGPQSSSRLLRGSTHIAGNNFFYQRDNVSSTKYHGTDHNISFLDSPNSTSAVTYNLQSRYQFGNALYIRNAMMTLMEIKG